MLGVDCDLKVSDDSGSTFGGDFNDFDDLGLSLVVISMISVIWV